MDQRDIDQGIGTTMESLPAVETAYGTMESLPALDVGYGTMESGMPDLRKYEKDFGTIESLPALDPGTWKNDRFAMTKEEDDGTDGSLSPTSPKVPAKGVSEPFVRRRVSDDQDRKRVHKERYATAPSHFDAPVLKKKAQQCEWDMMTGSFDERTPTKGTPKEQPGQKSQAKFSTWAPGTGSSGSDAVKPTPALDILKTEMDQAGGKEGKTASMKDMPPLESEEFANLTLSDDAQADILWQRSKTDDSEDPDVFQRQSSDEEPVSPYLFRRQAE